MTLFKRNVVETARHAAFANIESSVDIGTILPSQVFKGNFTQFRFFESDHIFSPTFVGVVSEFLIADGSRSCCLVNLTRTPVMKYDEAATVFLEAGMTGEQYYAQLLSGGPAKGWLFDFERYACASDGESWSIYCEKNNDVGVIALRDQSAVQLFASALEAMYAKDIETLIQEGPDAVVPFNMLVPTWRDGLLRHYGKAGGNAPATVQFV